MNIRIGYGFDVHQLKEGEDLILGGIKLPHVKGTVGHSDADVLIHVLCDAILGAANLRDIGYHFPNTNKKWRNVDSSVFVTYCKDELLKKGFSIKNLDINIIAEKPNINKYVLQMKKKISKLLNVQDKFISIKATTNEKIGFIGNGEGIAAEAIVMISNEKTY